MASLSVSQAILLIKTPKNAREIQKARAKRLRHKLHSEPETECDSAFIFSPSHTKFLEWVNRILKSEENFARFKELYRPPVPTNELVETIFSQFEKVFESENKYEKFNFTNPDLEPDAIDYRKAIGDFTFWETQGFETFKNSIDNIVIIDLPSLAEQKINPTDGRPQPYYYFLDIDNLLDIENTRVKAISYGKEETYFFRTEYVIFYEDPTTVCVFDDGFYRTFRYEVGKEPVILSETPHDLGYCPARSFWTTPLNSKTTLLKRSPITNSISQLDWLLAYSYFAQYLKLYAPFPIYAVYKGICTYKDPINKRKCKDGWMYTEGAAPGEKSNERCPKCANKMKVGPGNILEVQAPQEKDQPDLLNNPVKIYPAEKESLDAVNTEIESLWECIFENCVGGGIEVDQNQAKNEDQVAAAFESKTNVLLKIKKNFEIIHTFTMDTINRLRYGDEYIGGIIDYGDQFFQKDESLEIANYKTAKEQGLPTYDLAIRRDKINETRYRNNPDLVERLRILANLDPFPDTDETAMVALNKNMPDTIDPVDLVTKVHFNSFISRFEREQGNLLLFGSKLDFDKKISVIRQVIEDYATEYLDRRQVNVDKYAPVPEVDPNAQPKNKAFPSPKAA